MVRQEIATFPVLRRVGNTDDGKTNVQFLGRVAHLKLDQLTCVFRENFNHDNSIVDNVRMIDSLRADGLRLIWQIHVSFVGIGSAAMHCI